MVITPDSFQVAASMQLFSFINMFWNYYYELHNDYLSKFEDGFSSSSCMSTDIFHLARFMVVCLW